MVDSSIKTWLILASQFFTLDYRQKKVSLQNEKDLCERIYVSLILYKSYTNLLTFLKLEMFKDSVERSGQPFAVR